MLQVDEGDGEVTLFLDHWDDRVSNELVSRIVKALNVVVTRFLSEPEQTLSCLEMLGV